MKARGVQVRERYLKEHAELMDKVHEQSVDEIVKDEVNDEVKE